MEKISLATFENFPIAVGKQFKPSLPRAIALQMLLCFFMVNANVHVFLSFQISCRSWFSQRISRRRRLMRCIQIIVSDFIFKTL